MPKGVYEREPFSESHRRSLRLAQIKRYRDRTERRNQSEIALEIWSRDSYRKKITKARKKAWKRPESRLRLLDGVRRNRLLSVSNQKSSKICKKIFNFLKKSFPQLELEYNVSRMHVDLAIPQKKLAVEVDGWAHEYFSSMRERDKKRDKFLRSEGWKILRVKAPTKSVSSFVRSVNKCVSFFGKNRLYAKGAPS